MLWPKNANGTDSSGCNAPSSSSSTSSRHVRSGSFHLVSRPGSWMAQISMSPGRPSDQALYAEAPPPA
jgi:hypothetical protein